MNRIVRAAQALGVRSPINFRNKLAKVAALLVALMGLSLNVGIANAATLNHVSVALSSPLPGATANYNLTATGATTGTAVKCISEVYTTNSDGTGGIPAGMVTTGVTLDGATTFVNPSGWTLDTTGVASGTIIFSTSTAVDPVSPGSWDVDGVGNATPASASGFWVNFTTWTGAPAAGICTGTQEDDAMTGYTITGGSTMTMTVNNTLSFAVSGIAHATLCGSGGNTTGVTTTGTTSAEDSTATTIPFGTVTSAANAIACQELTAATNATNGYTIYIRDTAALANALNQKIPDVGSGTTGSYTGSQTNAAPGAFTDNTSSLATYPGFNQGAYGYTTSDQALGTGTANRFTNAGPNWAAYGHSAGSTGNGEVAYQANGVASTNYYIAHEVGITNLTQPGTYTTTVVYTCTPIY
ncbi:MAG TPA: hypothetical protein VMS08_01090 [Candidatus Saccharimonadia bacterium]|nr:hypothetical protein [Candidatus Saccharimonadia bacterium]